MTKDAWCESMDELYLTGAEEYANARNAAFDATLDKAVLAHRLASTFLKKARTCADKTGGTSITVQVDSHNTKDDRIIVSTTYVRKHTLEDEVHQWQTRLKSSQELLTGLKYIMDEAPPELYKPSQTAQSFLEYHAKVAKD